MGKWPQVGVAVRSPALEVFETQPWQSWPDVVWCFEQEAGLETSCSPSKRHFYLLWHGLGGACKGLCPECSLLVSAFPSFKVSLLSPDFTDLMEFHCHWALYLFIRLHKKIGKKLKRHWGIQREKREKERQRRKHTHSLFLSREERSHTFIFCFAPTKLCHRADRHRPVHVGIFVLFSLSLAQRYEGTKPPFIFPTHVRSYSPARSFSWGPWCQLCQT